MPFRLDLIIDFTSPYNPDHRPTTRRKCRAEQGSVVTALVVVPQHFQAPIAKLKHTITVISRSEAAHPDDTTYLFMLQVLETAAPGPHEIEFEISSLVSTKKETRTNSGTIDVSGGTCEDPPR
ncbi:hypothetical protein OV208_36370 [Corallococcus sp. bb12-1]|uniref:hypothetical protein n=1 Tax=Corallococcus sp. bb12-1 TaxID=2996784 RepID=UPI00227216AF|nr:hypothetical protein [Corallococcus sp. bb12-1]MCY1046837.1 hypothetical protein [Corallococcus sp. bb12-1]